MKNKLARQSMQLCEINPFMRYAELQPSVLSNVPFCRAYDYRIFYVVEGQAKFIYTDKTIRIGAGTLLYFRPGVPYYFDGKIKTIVLNFDMTRRQAHKKKALSPLDGLTFFDTSLIFENDPPPELEDLIVIENAFEIESKLQKCLAHYCFPTSLSDAATSAIIKEVLCYMVETSAAKTPHIPELVQRVTVYIQQNYDREISNSQISNEFGYHSYYLNRIFKKSTGTTIHQAVIQEKIRIAKRLLKETDLSVAAVANEVGFPDRAQFCTAFRKHTGYTPTEYKNHIHNKKD